ncbi:MAG: glycosyltransferase family 4 protein [Saprospiraceae bacterium]|jgi:glycosyltransferase involved in cell wall biosynthesis|nr:glycosyltransferase family 4 protein [Lewinellaceae bacterium]
MKILVSNFGRQYTAALLSVLERQGWLEGFYTSLAANKLPGILHRIFRKRAFAQIPAATITHFPVLFFFERLLRNLFPRISRLTGDLFDKNVARRIRASKAPIIITYENTNRATLKSAKKLGKTTILDLAQIHHEDVLRYGRWFLPPQRLRVEATAVNPRKAEALKYTDYVCTLSSFAADSMIKNGWPASRLFTVNLGIDPERFSPKTQYAKSGPLRLLFVGTIMHRKGLALLLRAVENLPPQTVTLQLIGPMGDAGDLLRKHAGYFNYLPFQHHEALVQHYQHADVFVFPSLLDSWAQTVLEAMACGTPAVVSENTGAKDAVQQGGGWVIPANDLQALQACLEKLLISRSEIEARGKKARQIALQYTWAHYQEQLTAALTEIRRRENILPQ